MAPEPPAGLLRLMKFSFLCSTLCLTAAGFLGLSAHDPSPGSEKELPEILAGITSETCDAQVQILSGPDMQGRATPSPGLDRAAAYIEEQLSALGYKPAGEEGSFRLPYDLNCLIAGEGTQCSWMDGEGNSHDLQLGSEFVPLPGSKMSGIRGEPVFVDYAIQAPKYRWKGIKASKIKGKVVFAFTGEPREDNPKSKAFDGPEITEHASFASKVKAVADAGATGLILVPDHVNFPTEEGPIPGVTPLAMSRRMRVDTLERMANWPDIPVISVSRKVAEQIFDTDLKEYQSSLNDKGKPKTLTAPKKVEVDFSVRWKQDPEYQTYNIGAILPGSDQDGEVLILGAHLDHVGLNIQAAMFGQGQVAVHPGADDNASGSAALLEVAKAFSGLQPKKDILFLWFTGEEIGLLGSRAYCADPIYPHEDTIAMLNMDMVARGNPNIMNIGGLWKRPDWVKFMNNLAKRSQVKIKLDTKSGRDLYARSDQYSFHEKKVPALFFFEGDLSANKVYHKPGDIAETIDAEKMAKITKMFAATAYALAVEDERPAN